MMYVAKVCQAMYVHCSSPVDASRLIELLTHHQPGIGFSDRLRGGGHDWPQLEHATFHSRCDDVTFWPKPDPVEGGVQGILI